MGKTNNKAFNQYVYWLDANDFHNAKTDLKGKGMAVSGVAMTPCEVLKASGNKIRYARPSIWSLVCKRQGSWYRDSDKAGKYMIVSDSRLPSEYDNFLDVQITESDFMPDEIPDNNELQQLVDDEAYSKTRPDEWEKAGIKDSVMFKILFTVTAFWGWGDNLKKYWLSQRANHANFLSHTYTTTIDGKDVPYSVAGNAGTCSSCVEFFNIIDNDSRKLVCACPGAVTFGNTKRDVYYDVLPVRVVS